MPIDASIYSNIKQFQQPDILESMGRAAQLSQYARQNRKLDLEEQKQEAIKLALSQGIGEDGKISPQTITALYKADPVTAMELQKNQLGLEKAKNDSQMSSVDMMKKVGELTLPGLYAIKKAPKEQKQDLFYRYADFWSKNGIPMNNVPQNYSDEWVNSTIGNLENPKDAIENQLKQSQIAKNYADSKGSTFDKAAKLRQERSGLPTTKATQDVSVAYNKIQKAAGNPSAAGDMSMIFGYMKMLDPGSTVREGEFANAQNAAGVPTRVLNVYNKVKTGERLSPEQRDDFLNQAGGLYASQIDQQNKIDEQYKNLAQKMGVNPEEAILNFNANEPIKKDSKQTGKGWVLINEANAKPIKLKPDLREINGSKYVKVRGGWEEIK